MTDAAKPSPPGAGAGDPEPDDAALIRRIATDRSRAAFRTLFDRYARKIKAYMIRGGAGADEADEATQEAFLAVWRRAETFDPTRASAAAWLFTIARNKRVDLVRRGARPELDPEDPALRPEAPASPAAALSAQERDARVREAMAALGEEQRLVVALSFFEGLPHGEISDRLGVPLGTVKSRLRLAFGKLRAALGPEARDELDDG